MNRSYGKIRHMQEANLMLERRLLVSRQYTNGIIGEETSSGNMDRNSKNWIYFVSIVGSTLPAPRMETYVGFNNTPQQRLTWGGPQGNYTLRVESSSLYMELFDEKDAVQSEKDLGLTNWWKTKGYAIDPNGERITIKFGDAEKIKTNINEFFKAYPPVGGAQVTAGGAQVTAGGGGAPVSNVINGITFTGNEKGQDGQPLTYLEKVSQAYKGQLNFTDDKGNLITGKVNYKDTIADGTGLSIKMNLGSLNKIEAEIDRKNDLKSSVNGFPFNIQCNSLDVNKIEADRDLQTKNIDGSIRISRARSLTFSPLVGTAIKRYCKAYFPKKVKGWGFDVAEYDN